MAMFVPVLLVMALAPEGLSLWVGPSFAAHSTGALRWLAIGTFVNGLAQVPYALVQAAHRPDLTAKFHVAEVPLYLLTLLWLLPHYGVEGAAIAWTLRAAVDAAALMGAAAVLLPPVAPTVARLGAFTVAAIGISWLVTVPAAFELRLAFTTVTIAALAVSAWTMMLDPDEREFVRGCLSPSRLFALES
jgi:O-antigen/teichoic acid export membrane protein